MTGSAPRRVPRLLRGVTVLGLLVLIAGFVVHVSLASRLDRIDGAFDGLGARPASTPGETILMLGTRPGGTADITWLTGEQSIESVMLVEIHSGGRRVQVQSIPPTATGGSVLSSSASTAVAAVERWSGRRVDHLMALEWRTFSRLATGSGVDPTYAYGSAPAVQHRYLRRVLEGTLHAELRRQPLRLYRALSVTASGAAVDDEWSALELEVLLIRLRNLRSQDISFS